jgi:hypothetical protein
VRVNARRVNVTGMTVDRHCKTVARAAHDHQARAAADLDLVLHPGAQPLGLLLQADTPERL